MRCGAVCKSKDQRGLVRERRRRVERAEAEALEAGGGAGEDVELFAVCPLHAVHGAATGAAVERGGGALAGVRARRARAEQGDVGGARARDARVLARRGTEAVDGAVVSGVADEIRGIALVHDVVTAEVAKVVYVVVIGGRQPNKRWQCPGSWHWHVLPPQFILSVLHGVQSARTSTAAVMRRADMAQGRMQRRPMITR